MKERRSFLKLAAAAAVPAAVPALGVALSGVAQGSEGDVKALMGGWTTLHTSPFGPFREFLTFSEGGGVIETNVLLHTNSSFDFSQFRPDLPKAVNASDGMGTWDRIGPRRVRVACRKLMFDGRRYFGDFYFKGTVMVTGDNLHAVWDQIWIVDTQNQLLLNLGTATSDGKRIE